MAIASTAIEIVAKAENYHHLSNVPYSIDPEHQPFILVRSADALE